MNASLQERAERMERDLHKKKIKFDWELLHRVGLTESRVVKKRYENGVKNTEFMQIGEELEEKSWL